MFSRNHKGPQEEQLSDCSFCSGWTSRTLWNREKQPKWRLDYQQYVNMVGLEEMKSTIECLIHLELTFTVITTIIIVVLEDSAECQPPSTVNFMHPLPCQYTQVQPCLINSISPAPSSQTQDAQTWSENHLSIGSKSNGRGKRGAQAVQGLATCAQGPGRHSGGCGKSPLTLCCFCCFRQEGRCI